MGSKIAPHAVMIAVNDVALSARQQLQVCLQVLHMFQTNSNPDQVVFNASLGPGFSAHTTMRGRCRMRDGRFCIPQVGRDRDQARGIN